MSKGAAQTMAAVTVLAVGLLLLAARLFGAVAWPWWWVTAPFWAPVVAWLALMALARGAEWLRLALIRWGERA